MNQLLVDAFQRASRLPEAEQERLANLILEEMAADLEWDALLASDVSESMLAELADAAVSDHLAGRTKALLPEDL